uniref:Uncharacterized protein n=1 Tax=virus sp. ctBM815 TaxID=2825806 RepID=A0A8S5RJN1_9VIRU|nr:MAG TPA: hypothetical protein [virus sp. ctBM815]DAG45430.1 MAG TPA: hypothetical protein [Caudoviricetes sp.]
MVIYPSLVSFSPDSLDSFSTILSNHSGLALISSASICLPNYV